MADLQIAQILGLDCLPIDRFDPAECAKQEAIAQGILEVRAAGRVPVGWRSNVRQSVLSKFTRQSEKPSAISKYCRRVRYRYQLPRGLSILAA